MRLITFILLTLPTAVAAAPYERPIPQAQSATAEIWFSAASLALCIALFCVHRLVNRK
jgi:hypothetical protein